MNITFALDESLDAAIYGDAEFVVRQIIEKRYNLGEVQGIYYRQNGRIVGNKPHPPVTDLDAYGIAAHDMIDRSLYHDPLAGKSSLTVTYSQIGCVNSCTYCMSQLYAPLRMRSVPHFMKELRFIKQLGFREVFFIDCGITNNRPWADELFGRMIDESLGLSWWGLARADRLDEKIMTRMKKAGCHSIGTGVESANVKVISNVRKQVDLNQVVNVVRIAHRLKMRILLYFQFGLPGETRESMKETLQFALKSGADLATFGIATPVPGTHFFEYIKENNLFITHDWSKFDPALPPVFDYPQLNGREIYAFSKYAYRSFYLRPSFIMRRFIEQRSIGEVIKNWDNFTNLMGRMSRKSDGSCAGRS